MHGARRARQWPRPASTTTTQRAALRRGRRAFLLNPPADTKLDTDVVENHSVAQILGALEGSGLEKVVAHSAMGAQPGERVGDLRVLWNFEQGLGRQSIPAAIDRAAYFMSNWDDLLEPVRKTGKLPTMFDAELAIPMVAARDLGEFAAQRLLSGIDDIGMRAAEGPARYTPTDVANAFADALGRPVEVDVIPRDQWLAAYRGLGFSEPAADAYARMTAATIDGGFDRPDGAWRGTTTLQAYIRELVIAAPAPRP